MTNILPTTPSARSAAPAEASTLVETSAATPPPAQNIANTDDEADIRFGPPDVYDPAEYRWVPVRRRPRRDGWTEEKQRRFIEVLADTGMVALAAKAVGMSRKSAYELKRSAHGAPFSRAWDAARAHAGALLEDIAFERAIEGREENVFNEYGEVIATKHLPDNRMLTFLLTRLMPERYGNAAAAPSEKQPAPVAVDACLRAMEPQLPAPAEQLLGPETLADELEIADIADGKLPGFLNETPPIKSDAQIAAEERAARYARGKAASEKLDAAGGKGDVLSDSECADMCFYLDPTPPPPSAKRFR
jgi:hypothetical protein